MSLISIVAVACIPGGAVKKYNRAVDFHRQASTEENKEDQEKAAKLYNLAIADYPQFTSAHVNLGSLHFDQGQFIEAIPHFERAKALSANDQDFLWHFGMSYQQADKLNKALAIFEEILSLDLSEEKRAQIERKMRLVKIRREWILNVE